MVACVQCLLLRRKQPRLLVLVYNTCLSGGSKHLVIAFMHVMGKQQATEEMRNTAVTAL